MVKTTKPVLLTFAEGDINREAVKLPTTRGFITLYQKMLDVYKNHLHDAALNIIQRFIGRWIFVHRIARRCKYSKFWTRPSHVPEYISSYYYETHSNMRMLYSSFCTYDRGYWCISHGEFYLLKISYDGQYVFQNWTNFKTGDADAEKYAKLGNPKWQQDQYLTLMQIIMHHKNLVKQGKINFLRIGWLAGTSVLLQHLNYTEKELYCELIRLATAPNGTRYDSQLIKDMWS